MVMRSPRKRVAARPCRFEPCTLRLPNFMINLSTENLIIIILLAVLIAWTIVLQIWLAKVQKKMKIFLKGKKVKDLEEVISEQLKRMRGIEGNVNKLFQWNEDLQKIVDISITKVGVVRFNPFKDTGGDQSFVVALLDSKNNGLVLSSLFTREGTRVYTKPIEKGTSTYNLSNEEQEAIQKAINP
jgi:cell division protein FtsL